MWKNWSKKTWFAIIGGVILFSSWIVERHKQSDWTNKIEKLNRSQLVIDITEVQRSNYEIAYTAEVQKKEPDSLIMGFLQIGLCRTYMDLLTWSKGRIIDNAEQYNRIINTKRQIDSTNRASLAFNNYSIINSNFNLVQTEFIKNYLKLDNDFSIRVDEVRSNEYFFDLIFNILYIGGSILLGISYLLENKVQTKIETNPINKTKKTTANRR